MRKRIITTVILAVVAASPAFARGGHGHSSHGHSMHRHSARAPLPSGRPLKNADNSSTEKRDPEDVKLDQKIRSICRGC